MDYANGTAHTPPWKVLPCMTSVRALPNFSAAPSANQPFAAANTLPPPPSAQAPTFQQTLEQNNYIASLLATIETLTAQLAALTQATSSPTVATATTSSNFTTDLPTYTPNTSATQSYLPNLPTYSPPSYTRPPANESNPSLMPPTRTGSLRFEDNPERAYYEKMTREAAVRYGVNPDILVAQLWQESRLNPEAGSGAGAKGIAQIVPKYHPGVDPMNPQEAVNYAAKHMRELLDKHGSYEYALAAYNGGQGAVDYFKKRGGIFYEPSADPAAYSRQTGYYVMHILKDAQQNATTGMAIEQNPALYRNGVTTLPEGAVG